MAADAGRRPDAPPDEEMPAWVGWVKGASVAMGVLIVVALAVVAYGVARRAGLAGGQAEAPASVPAPASLPPAGAPGAGLGAAPAFSGPPAALPAGTRILDAAPAPGGLAVRTDDPDGGQTLWLVAPGPDGRTTATPLLAAPPRP
jgi:hypothetical protein